MEFHITVQQYDKDRAGGWFDDVSIEAQETSIPAVLRRLADLWDEYAKEFGEPRFDLARFLERTAAIQSSTDGFYPTSGKPERED